MLTVPEAAARTGHSPETIRRWIRAGKLRATKVGTQHMIDERDLASASGARTREHPAAYRPQVVDISPKLLARIATDPTVLSGKPIVTGTRLSVELILELLASGWTVDELIDNYPTVTRDDVQACFAFAASRLGEQEFYPLS